MGSLIFCNIGWMSRYRGLKGQADRIVGGGKYVEENRRGGEICNFLPTDDGYVYGHVETILRGRDRQIKLENSFGCSRDASMVEGVDVVWTATHPLEGGRRVVGWYRDATIFRTRQKFSSPPSRQHKSDSLSEYRIRVLADKVHCLDIEDRNLRLDHGPGWMGQAAWWTPSKAAGDDIQKFVRSVRRLIEKESGARTKSRKAVIERSHTSRATLGGAAAASDPYVRYVKSYEVKVLPIHDKLQRRFKKFAISQGAKDILENVDRVDFRYDEPERGTILTEIKPCTLGDARFAIRTAMGQLLDYRHAIGAAGGMLIVVGVKPKLVDQDLAIRNGFGIAYPKSKVGFEFRWPKRRR